MLDFHTIYAAIRGGVKYSEVTQPMRGAAKAILFGYFYSPERVGNELPWPSREAFMAIYTADQIKQLQIDTQWPGTVDLYEHIKTYVRNQYAMPETKCKD